MQERSDSECAFDTAILGIACLCDAEMKRIIHPLAIHLLHKKAHGLYHNHRVGGLDRDDYIIEIHLPRYPQELHNGLHHAGCGISVSAHYSVGERAMIHSDTHRAFPLRTQ